MKILVTIAHYFNPDGGGKHGSLSKDPRSRIVALSQSLTHLAAILGKYQGVLDIAKSLAVPANQGQSLDIDIVICTTQNRHVLDDLPVPHQIYKHHATQAEPLMLGFECHALLRDSLGRYDYYCYMEDDLILHDPWFFIKLNWFSSQAGDLNLLQPNRYEISPPGRVGKVYIDGDLLPRATAQFQKVEDRPELKGNIMEQPVLFRRSLNPHSGCFFLNAKQMAHWASQPYFLDRDTSFIGPLESVATLGIMRTFRIYKPDPTYAGFLEIQHFGTAFLNLIGRGINISPG
ncbi:calcium-binding protein [Laspinema sp. A4]|uniref:calcium-binding protein n=1 Tax=Laspinema sp. D2d TaxID=2953686 RepID=UPI0021BA6F86|nr:calcium-binding protein [Laspinema sp. D2d]MCT7982333.1 calcium-binding protein [Laspinema sp. D2d]